MLLHPSAPVGVGFPAYRLHRRLVPFYFYSRSQFLADPQDLDLASGYLLRAYDITKDPGTLINRAMALPIIMGSVQEYQGDRARVEAGLDDLLRMDIRCESLLQLQTQLQTQCVADAVADAVSPTNAVSPPTQLRMYLLDASSLLALLCAALGGTRTWVRAERCLSPWCTTARMTVESWCVAPST